MSSTPLSAAECLLLLEPASRGHDTLKVALKELLARSALRLEVRQVKRLFGGLRDEVYLRVQRGPELSSRVLAELHRALASISGNSTTLAEAMRALRSRYGQAYSGFHDELVVSSLLRAGLVARRQEPLLWIFSRSVVRPNAIGLRRQAELRDRMDRARRDMARKDARPAELAALAASLGSLVILMPEHWPQWRRIEQELRLRDGSAGGGGDFEWSVELEDVDRHCADVDAAVDAGDGGDGGGDGGGD